MTRILVLLLAVVASCAPKAPPLRPGPEAAALIAPPEPVRPAATIVVREDPAQDGWRVTYRFDEPAQQLVFLTKRNAFRSGWSVETPGYAWRQSSGHEVLATSGEPQHEITIAFPSDFAHKPKDYELNLRFTDGSRLLYLGHLVALPCAGVACTEVLDGGETATFGFELMTAAGRRVIAAGQAAEGHLTLAPLTSEGASYAYFGTIAPIETADAIVVLDPGMPAWLVAQASESLPKLIAHFASHVGMKLDFKPLLFLSFGGTERKGRSTGGGVAARVVQIMAEGEGWMKPSPATRAHWFHTVAHEAFHLWNGQLFHRGGGVGEEWLSEGAADLFAMRAAWELGVIDELELRRRLVRAANRCILRAEGEPLSTAHERGDHDNFYSCGSVLLFALGERVGRATGGEKDIDDVFGAMFRRAAKTPERRYTTRDLLLSAVDVSGDAQIGGPLERVLNEGVPKAMGTLLLDLFRRAGWAVDLDEHLEGTLDPRDHLSALATKLARCDCGLRRSYRLRAKSIAFAAAPQCNVFSEELEVARVNGVAVTDPTALRTVLDAINGEAPLSVATVDGTERQLACDDYRDESIDGLIRLVPSK